MRVQMTPSDSSLLAELTVIKGENPGLGVARLSGLLHEIHPNWRVNAKRVRKVLKAHGLMSPGVSPGTSPASAGVAPSPLAALTAADDDVGARMAQYSRGREKLSGDNERLCSRASGLDRTAYINDNDDDEKAEEQPPASNLSSSASSSSSSHSSLLPDDQDQLSSTPPTMSAVLATLDAGFTMVEEKDWSREDHALTCGDDDEAAGHLDDLDGADDEMGWVLINEG